MMASATKGDATDESVDAGPRLGIDFDTYEEFRVAFAPREGTPLIVRWFGCLARSECGSK